jgi:hypothetical protein
MIKDLSKIFFGCVNYKNNEISIYKNFCVYSFLKDFYNNIVCK